MKKFILSVVLALITITTIAGNDGKSYKELWNLVNESLKKDLPDDMLNTTKLIAEKAKKEKQKGHYAIANTLACIFEQAKNNSDKEEFLDSFDLKNEELRKTDPVMAAMNYALMANMMGANSFMRKIPEGALEEHQVTLMNMLEMDDDTAVVDSAITEDDIDSVAVDSDTDEEEGFDIPYSNEKLKYEEIFRKKAMRDVDILAHTKAAEFAPLVAEGKDGNIFNHDLLHVIGFETENFQALKDYYQKNGNREAECICAGFLAKSDKELDSLMNAYSDCEAAAELSYMEFQKVLDYRHDDDALGKKYQNLRMAIQKWGGWQRSSFLKNAVEYLTNPMLSTSDMAGDFTPDGKNILFFRTRNINHVNIVLKSKKKNSKPRSYELNIPKICPAITQLDSINLKHMEPGEYSVFFSTEYNEIKDTADIVVSNLNVFANKLPGNIMRYVAVNATTGRPIPKAKLTLYQEETDDEGNETETSKSVVCDKNGEVFYHYKKKEPSEVVIKTAHEIWLTCKTM